MRRGYDAHLLFDKKGRLFGFATGADACAEHECGSKPMQQSLSQGALSFHREEATLVEQLRRKLNGEKTLLERLLPEKPVVYPQLIERKRLDRNLDKLVFIKDVVDGQPAAVFGYSPRNHLREFGLTHGELRFYNETIVVTGAWSEEAFAIAVRGQKLVDKLEEFAAAVKAGDGLFAGTFLERNEGQHLAGVILVRESMLRPEHKTAIAKAQTQFEEKLRLTARSRLPELEAMRKTLAQSKPRGEHWPGHLWPVWRDGVVDGEVLYALNPAYGVKAPYWGPYDFDQLAAWIAAEGKKPQLVPIERKAA